MATTAALDTSYAALEPRTRRLYLTLGSLPNLTLTAELAAAVSEMPLPDAGRSLAVLADARLLEPAPDSPEHSYRMGAAVRDHAQAMASDDEGFGTTDYVTALRGMCDWLVADARSAHPTPAQAAPLHPGPAGGEVFADGQTAAQPAPGRAAGR
ncbi:hypothetical protein [Streptomyces anthocyanicus]|uniref:hypothetical protein n=1 Tax=Streptomyces anthocyanicus TaxID=68174 RepID=UPI0037F966BA